MVSFCLTLAGAAVMPKMCGRGANSAFCRKQAVATPCRCFVQAIEHCPSGGHTQHAWNLHREYGCSLGPVKQAPFLHQCTSSPSPTPRLRVVELLHDAVVRVPGLGVVRLVEAQQVDLAELQGRGGEVLASKQRRSVKVLPSCCDDAWPRRSAGFTALCTALFSLEVLASGQHARACLDDAVAQQVEQYLGGHGKHVVAGKGCPPPGEGCKEGQHARIWDVPSSMHYSSRAE